ncbi:MAG: pleckstrin/ G-protein interacting- domain protein [Cyanobacteria bacterium J06627_8]
MLLLPANQVTYCKVIQPTDHGAETIDGVSYQNKLFKKVNFFPEVKKQDAIFYAKQLTLDSKGMALVLVIKEQDLMDDVFAVWQEDRALRIKELKDYTADQMDLKELVTKMRDIGGLRIEDRTYNLTTYARCFVGTDVVLWLMQTLHISEEDAIRIGKRLVDDQWIHHVTNEHDFENAYLFYRFRWDD